MGWTVIRVWEHACKDLEAVVARIAAAVAEAGQELPGLGLVGVAAPGLRSERWALLAGRRAYGMRDPGGRGRRS